jgi:uncharacterized surface protein with fasciclin (FAS1) repeats
MDCCTFFAGTENLQQKRPLAYDFDHKMVSDNIQDLNKKIFNAMKTTRLAALVFTMLAFACSRQANEITTETSTPVEKGQSSVQDDESQKNIVQTAVASPDHQTLVAALKAASYVDALSNAGPFTVFAPNDQAFAELPKGTLDDLLKPENKDKLQNILEYHVYVGVIRESMVNGSMNLNQVNGKNVTLLKEGDKLKVNGNEILAAVNTSNGVVYIINKVLLPPQ